MSVILVRGLYDFLGDPDGNEISITAGEIITVNTLESEDGWLEGTNANGDFGLFPQNYVEVIDNDGNIYWDLQEFYNKNPQEAAITQVVRPDPEWYTPDSDNESIYNTAEGDASKEKEKEIISCPLPPPPTKTSQASAGEQAPSTLNAIINTPSRLFTRTTDYYILGNSGIDIPKTGYSNIVNVSNGYMWHRINDPYTVSVYSPRKESKFVGMKSFIAYRLKPSFNNTVVSNQK